LQFCKKKLNKIQAATGLFLDQLSLIESGFLSRNSIISVLSFAGIAIIRKINLFPDKN
jgi:hypothetical protein